MCGGQCAQKGHGVVAERFGMTELPAGRLECVGEDGVVSSDPAVLAAAGSLRNDDSGFKHYLNSRGGDERAMRDFI